MINYCVYPFRHISINVLGYFQACCVDTEGFQTRVQDVEDIYEWWETNQESKNLRQDFLTDQKPSRCRNCWQQEAQGLPSMRTKNLEHLSKKLTSPQLFDVEITGGRLCNLACKMCGPTPSTLIAKESRPWNNSNNHPKFKDSYNWLDDSVQQEKVVELLSRPECRVLYFTGGEPQIMPCYQELLNKWSTVDDLSKKKIHFNTNSTVFNQDFWSQVAKFGDKIVDLSIDGVGDAYDYLRLGGSWSKTQQAALQTANYISSIDQTSINWLSLVSVFQLGNIDQALPLQQFYELLNVDRHIDAKYFTDFILLPVTDNPGYSAQQIPVPILEQEYAKIKDCSADQIVLAKFKQFIESALEHNQFGPSSADDVLKKEKYFARVHNKSLFDRKPEWYRYYKPYDQ